MKNIFFLLTGILIGSLISWPGILGIRNWKCFFDIVDKSNNDEISLKATLAVSPKYLLNGDNNNLLSKIRIVSDACFR